MDNKPILPKNIKEIYSVYKHTIRRYFKKGFEYGWCDYNSKTYASINGPKNSEIQWIPIGV